MFSCSPRAGTYSRWTTIFPVAAAAWFIASSLPASALAQQPVEFELHPNPDFLECLAADPANPPVAQARVARGRKNDTLTLQVSGLKPNLVFDLFTVERTPLNPDGTTGNPDFATAGDSFGLAWYQSEIQADGGGEVRVKIKTVLLDEIFGLDQDIPELDATSPETTHHTFHVGFWFDDPADAAECGFSGQTPFNGIQSAGPLAMISVPDPDTNLGPLCTNPDTSTDPASCSP